LKRPIQVTVLGQPYTVRTEASPAEVHAVAAYVNDRVAEIIANGQTVDTLNAAVLALMNMSGDYLRSSKKLQHLLTRLDTELPAIDPAGKKE